MKTIEQINADIENIQRLLVTHNDRLQVLREQQAQFGIHCPPHIVTEIKQIETEMEALDTQLQQLNQEKEYLAAPVVVMANFAPLPSNLPPKRVEFDWSDEFVFSPRQVPSPERWSELLPEIMALSTQSGLVRYHQGSSSLSSAFAVGQALRNVGGRRLAIEQHSPDKTTVWFSQVSPEVTESFVVHQSAVNPDAVTQQGQPGKDALVVVFALTQTTAPVVVGEVGAYWGETFALKQVITAEPASFMPQHARGVLVLEATATSQEQSLTGEQAASLAATSRRKLMEFIGETEPEMLHLFLACPAGLATLIGHHWNQVGLAIQCYERLGHSSYTPSFCIPADAG